jgi:hypothetical protein
MNTECVDDNGVWKHCYKKIKIMRPIGEIGRQDLRLGVKALEQIPPQMNSKKEVEVAYEQTWGEAGFSKVGKRKRTREQPRPNLMESY